jgi:hypothetical protein
MPTTTNYGWTTPADTDLVKDGASAIRTLGTAIDTTVFNNAGAAIAKTIVDAKGDLIVASGSDAVARLAVGTNDYVLTADSGATNGVKWAALPPSGGMTLISETTASAATDINLTSIPGTYKQLMLVWSGLNPSNATSIWALRLNNDTTANVYQGVLSTGSTVSGFSTDNGDDAGNGFGLFGYDAQSSSTDYHMQSKGVLLIDNYASTTKYKYYKGDASWRANGSVYREPRLSAVYKSTSAITSIDIVRVFGTGTFTNET